MFINKNTLKKPSNGTLVALFIFFFLVTIVSASVGIGAETVNKDISRYACAVSVNCILILVLIAKVWTLK